MTTESNSTIQIAARKRRETLYWGAVLLWAGLVFALEQLRVLPQIERADAWNWVFFGAGLLSLVWSIQRTLAPDRPEPSASLWNFVWAGVLLIFGLSPLAPVQVGIPLILLLIGAALLATARFASDKRLT